jgi:hypothetical protein
VKDFDVWAFFAEHPARPFPHRRRGRKDFGPSRFGDILPTRASRGAASTSWAGRSSAPRGEPRPPACRHGCGRDVP